MTVHEELEVGVDEDYNWERETNWEMVVRVKRVGRVNGQVRRQGKSESPQRGTHDLGCHGKRSEFRGGIKKSKRVKSKGPHKGTSWQECVQGDL